MSAGKDDAPWLTVGLTIAAVVLAGLAWWWTPALVAPTPIAELGFAPRLVLVLAVLWAFDWLTERWFARGRS